nr:FUSC family protein [uncultured Halomonas sp.]
MSLLRLRDPYFSYHYRHYLHVLRTSLALATTFVVISTLQIPHGSWALISALAVVGNLPNVGSVLDKGGQRLLGTILGITWGIVLMLIPDPPIGVVPIWTLISIALATYATFATRHGYSALIFGISVLLVVGSGNHDLDIALWRAFNVLLGTLIGILVTVLVMPQKATDVLRFLLADNLDKLARLYHAHTSAAAENDIDIDTQELLKTVTAQLVEQRKLVDAIHSERRLRRNELDSLLSLQRRMLSTIELILQTRWVTRIGYERIASMKGLREAQHRLARVLGTLAFQVRTGQSIEVQVKRFDLDQYANQATFARDENGQMLFGPSGYLWLNRELTRLTRELSLRLGRLRHLPSKRLRQRASQHTLVSDSQRLRPDSGKSSSSDTRTRHNDS